MPALTPEHIHFRSYLLAVLPGSVASVARGAYRRHRTAHVEFDAGIVLQPDLLTDRNPVLRRMSETERNMMAVGLTWVVLLDEAVYTHHRPDYATFREFTRFPKLVGDCPGGCSTHRHPLEALSLVRGAGDDSLTTAMSRRALLEWSVPVVQDIVCNLADMQEVPCLRAGLPGWLSEVGIEAPEPQGRTDGRIRDWRFPVISREDFDRRFEMAAEQLRTRLAVPHRRAWHRETS